MEVAVRDPVLGLHAPQLTEVPGARIEFTSGDVAPVHAEMVAAAGGRNVWIVGGGDLAGQFADAGLLDEVLVTIAPVTLGAGAPLLPRRIELRLDEVGAQRRLRVRPLLGRADGRPVAAPCRRRGSARGGGRRRRRRPRC